MPVVSLRPSSDVSVTDWETGTGSSSNLYAEIDETSVSSSDYIATEGGTAKFELTNPSADIAAATMRVRFRKDGDDEANLTVRLLQNNPTTLNPVDKHSSITLSGGNLVATMSTNEYAGVRSVASYSSGKKYCEVTWNASSTSMDPDLGAVGIVHSGNDLSDLTSSTTPWGITYGSNDHCIEHSWLGDSWLSGTGQVADFPAYSAGDTMCIAVDFDNQKVWHRRNGGNWNNDVIGNQNPASNIGGQSISTVFAFAPFYIMLSLNLGGTNPSIITCNFGASAYTHDCPAGFTNWDSEVEIASWEYTDIADTDTDIEVALTAPQFALITDPSDLRVEFEASVSSGGGAYDPASDAGLVVWYKADDGPKDSGAATPTNGEEVNTWLDSSGSGATLTYSGSNPAALTYVTNSLNSLPGVTQTGGAGLISANNPVALDSTTLTAIVLMKKTTGAAFGARIFDVYGDGMTNAHTNAKSFSFFVAGTVDEDLVTVFGNSDYLLDGTDWTTGWSSGTARAVAVQFNGTNSLVYLSGSQVGSSHAWTSAIGDNVVKTLNLFGGANASENGRGTVYEVILTTTVLDLSPDGPVDQYFTAKWGAY